MFTVTNEVTYCNVDGGQGRHTEGREAVFFYCFFKTLVFFRPKTKINCFEVFLFVLARRRRKILQFLHFFNIFLMF